MAPRVRKWGRLRPGEAVGWQWVWVEGDGRESPASAVAITWRWLCSHKPDKRWNPGALLVARRVVYRLRRDEMDAKTAG